MKYSNEINEICSAIVKIQAEIKNPIKNNTNDGVKGKPKYANLEDTLAEYVRPVCTKYGVAVFQSLNTNEKGQVGVSTTLIHESGQYIEGDYVYCDVVIPVSNQGKKVLTEGQATGVCITYLRRYSLNAALGINGDKDTDGSYQDRELTYEDAINYEVGFGKYNGKTLKEIKDCDPSYYEWLADKGDDEIKEAIEIIFNTENENAINQQAPIDKHTVMVIETLCKETGTEVATLLNGKFNAISDMTVADGNKAVAWLQKQRAKK